jgi:hypothetical protein
MNVDCFSSGLQHTQNRCDAAKEVEPAVVAEDLLIGSGVGTEKAAQLVVDPAKTPGCRGHLNPRIGP